MKRLLVSAAMVMAVVCMLPLKGQTKDLFNLKQVAKATTVMTIDGPLGSGHCTAFSINESKRLYMTAAHCYIGDDYIKSIDGDPVKVIERNAQSDLMVVQSWGSQPNVKFAKNITVGEWVAGYGYGMDVPGPVLTPGVVVSLNMNLGDENEPYNRLVVSGAALMPGMSGGPMINRNGEVVSVNQCSGSPGTPYQGISCFALRESVLSMVLKYAAESAIF